MVTHRELCVTTVRYLLENPIYGLAGWELRYNRGFADALAVTIKDRASNPRITCVEVKRTRADMLADLKARKMLKYEKGSTHCYLACTPECLRLDRQPIAQAIEELTELGLPTKWGILIIRGDVVTSIRNAYSIGPYNKTRARALIKKLARSNMFRALGLPNDDRESLSDLEEEC